MVTAVFWVFGHLIVSLNVIKIVLKEQYSDGFERNTVWTDLHEGVWDYVSESSTQ